MAHVLFNTDALTALRAMEADSVNCCVTSPPYWGLRDYKVEPLVWGGVGCEHEWGEYVGSERRAPRADSVEVVGSSDGGGTTPR